MVPKTFLLYCIITCLPWAVQACTVTIEDEDKTNEFLVTTEDGKSYVDCMGPRKCEKAVIVDCPTIKCGDKEACYQAQILNFTESVLCEGTHACHDADIVLADDNVSEETSVACMGSMACAMTRIMGPIKQVSCVGTKACRKTHVEGSKLVKCHDGHERALACLNLATFETECLYCGMNGCASRINQCRLKLLGDGDVAESYEKCTPDSVVGNCPEILEEEMKLEASTKLNDVEGGERRRLRR
mmetsp:Transcript_5624/g.8873  ORF Transcript_5624/g.8873 Transcript_5624/m.8873 type:complete len:243 (+) Transcript_5624:218-946(+)